MNDKHACCIGCGATDTETLVDFGTQPPHNRFLKAREIVRDRHPLVIGVCGKCGLIQLKDPMPPSMVRSHHEWLTYNEPEGHLDALVEHLAARIAPDAKIFGLSYKDDSTLARFEKLGYGATFRYDMKADLGINDPCAGLETIQALMTEEQAAELAMKHGKADLLIVRHVLEHAHDPSGFMKALGKLVNPGGKIVFEMPDCRKFVDACDYSFVWEEHISYFSQSTMKGFAFRNGFAVEEMLAYPYPFEDSLIAVLTAGNASRETLPDEAEIASARRFAAHFDSAKKAYRDYFSRLHASGKHIAVFGAGHLAAKFLNLFDLKDFFDYVIDDNPHKQGLAMPGSGLPIVDSSHLPETDLCMLSLSPESEQKVLARQQAYVQYGGRFFSIFALSPSALKP